LREWLVVVQRLMWVGLHTAPLQWKVLETTAVGGPCDQWAGRRWAMRLLTTLFSKLLCYLFIFPESVRSIEWGANVRCTLCHAVDHWRTH
jgi:hypothetical protein